MTDCDRFSATSLRDSRRFRGPRRPGIAPSRMTSAEAVASRKGQSACRNPARDAIALFRRKKTAVSRRPYC